MTKKSCKCKCPSKSSRTYIVPDDKRRYEQERKYQEKVKKKFKERRLTF